MSKNQNPASNEPTITRKAGAVEEGDEPDDWDKRIIKTGCSAENQKLHDCYYEKRDWRLCKAEMDAFRECWKQKGNLKRTDA